ncbi:TPA: hypothetical protein ACK8Z3_000029 [Legionella pneumophila]|uniref:Uncharacterized protein n=1 Tax=Legionella pneumophila subsp. pneumophila TaxID=91891 RepID=A0A3A6VCN3_LEGPN|nr:hypothetical protein [Legionella pneumophila]ERH45712.1 hypothetical protein N750_06270 [Legionella pneumophila str. Leg01/53]ERH46456.1 hypothetical protein N751_07840 [Legionella pneumophila str. Leg01/11]ERI49556.1 hypothetical protein N749_00795 [Legionella pneumophila str. Leg01/20]ANN96746.1 hypothetical protein A9P84_13975 [Legionella pneumophila]AOU11672.1 hypothetical protein A9F03_13890 [Legionella pneumophila]
MLKAIGTHFNNIKHYDELYYLDQIKHGFPIGFSLATKINENYVIYSIASHQSCAFTRELFSTHQEDFPSQYLILTSH